MARVGGFIANLGLLMDQFPVQFVIMATLAATGLSLIYLDEDTSYAVPNGVPGQQLIIWDNLGLAATANQTLSGNFFVTGQAQGSITFSQTGQAIWLFWDSNNGYWSVPNWWGAL